MTDNKIQAYAERIQRLLDERDAINADVKDIYEEVKSADFKPKVLRKAIANMRRKADATFDAEVEAYSAYLLAMPGATYRSVAEQTGISKSKLQRLVPREENGTPHNPETGEIGEVDFPGVDAGQPSEPSDPAEQSVNSDPSPGRVSPSVVNGQGQQSGTNSDDLAIPAFLDVRRVSA